MGKLKCYGASTLWEITRYLRLFRTKSFFELESIGTYFYFKHLISAFF